MSTTPSRSTFDPAAVSRGTWAAAGGSLILLISVWMSWYSVSVSAFGGASGKVNGWDATDISKLVALLALAGLAIVAIELFATNVSLPYPSSLILIGIGGLSTLLVLFRILVKPDAPTGVSVGLAYGIFVALLAAIAVAVGGYLKMQEG